MGKLTNSAADTSAIYRAQYETLERHLHMFFEVAGLFNSESSLSGTVDITLETIWQIEGVDYIAILLGENELGPFRYVGLRGVDNPLSILGQTCPVPLWGVLAQTLVRKPDPGKPDYVLINDIAAAGSPRPEEFPWLESRGTLMIVPLRSNGHTIGAIVVGSKEANRFRDDIMWRYLYAVAGIAARALQDARLREQTRRWTRQLVSLQLLTGALAGAHELEQIATSLCNEVADIFAGAHVAILVQPGTERGSLDGLDRGRRSQPGREGTATSVPFGFTAFTSNDGIRHTLATAVVEPMVRWVMEAQQPLFFDPDSPVTEATDLYYRASGHALLVPITGADDSVYGVIFLLAPSQSAPFDENDLVVLRIIANSAASALHSAQLHHLAQSTPASRRQP